MQLAKNLFLSREKTLARKLEELILADYLEQAFTKDEMMELYLNIIEFGPDIYGVRAAAEHYFGRKPNELNLAECMFLSSILPNPIAFHKVYEDGQLGDGWMRIIRARMEIAHQTGLISAAELSEGLAEPVVFHRAEAPLPAPRSPIATPSHPNGAQADWNELN
jgi:membrane peptidoglycan carboxypeptidase